MSDIKLIELKQEKSRPQRVSAKGHMEKAPKHYEAEKKSLSENIIKFDKRKRISSPYDYNTVSLNKTVKYDPTADEMISNPTYNTVGKFLGVDTHHEWGQYYNKVRTLVDWAKKKTGKEDTISVMNFLNGALSAAPSFGMHHKRIDQLYLYARMNML